MGLIYLSHPLHNQIDRGNPDTMFNNLSKDYIIRICINHFLLTLELILQPILYPRYSVTFCAATIFSQDFISTTSIFH